MIWTVVVVIVVVVELAMTMLPIGCATGGVTWGYFRWVAETGVFVSRWLVLHCLTASGIYRLLQPGARP